MKDKSRDNRPCAAGKLHLICQSHIDPVWLWTWRDGFAQVLTTLQSAVDRMNEFPEMKYTCSSAVFYRLVKETDPTLFTRIKNLIEQGRWEVVGGWIVQPDTLAPGKWGLRRQGQLGQEWLEKNLGVRAAIGYCVDSFGQSAGLPSILAESGMKYYVFQRPDPSERPDLPNLFWWEGPDKTRVLTLRLASGYGQVPGCSEEDLEKQLRENCYKCLHEPMPIGTWFIGIGNHGGGPTRCHITRLKRLVDSGDPSIPGLIFSNLSDFFADVERHPELDKLPVISGELLDHSRGCYSVNTSFKRLYRQTERILLAAENMDNLLNEAPGREENPGMPPPDLPEDWWTLCFNQFHDILPGTSIPEAYREARDDLGKIRHNARRKIVEAVHRMSRSSDMREAPEGVLFLANHLPRARSAAVRLDAMVSPHGDSPITHLASPGGDRFPIQWTAAESAFGPHLREWKKLVSVVPLPASSCRWFNMAHGQPLQGGKESEAAKELKDLLLDGRLIAVEDTADTWGHKVHRWDKEVGRLEKMKEEIIDDGPVFRRLRLWFAWSRSEVVMDISEWHPLNAAEVVLYINWQDRFTALKFQMPNREKQTKLVVDTPGAAVERPFDANEFFFGNWMLLDGADKRLLIVSDGVSAYDASPERLRLTILRCVPYAQHNPVPHPAESPQNFIDQGYQEARFWLTKPGESMSVETIGELAEELLNPPEHMLDSAHPPSR